MQTGQSEPNISRSGPNSSSSRSRVGPDVLLAPVAPVGLGDEAGELAVDPLVRGERREVGAPRLALAGRDVGLGAVVDDERELRERGGDPRGRRQVLGEQQQVVGQAGLRDGAQAARDVVALEPARVGLVVDRVADPDQALPARGLPAGRRAARRRRAR